MYFVFKKNRHVLYSKRDLKTLLFKPGFTLVELLVVIAIIGILMAIMSASFSAAKSSARDKARRADLANLHQGLRLYAEENGEYPDFPEGIEIGAGNAIDGLLADYFTKIPHDPLNGSDISKYWYDSVFPCNGEYHIALIETNMELASNGNYQEVCGGSVALKDAPEPKPNLLLPSIVNTVYAAKGDSSSSETPSCTVDSFTASPSTLDYPGGTTVLSWSTTHVESYGVSISPGVGSGLPRDGSRSVSVSQTTTFLLSGTGESGYWVGKDYFGTDYSNCSGSVTVSVSAQPEPDPTPTPDPTPDPTPEPDVTDPASLDLGANAYIILLN